MAFRNPFFNGQGSGTGTPGEPGTPGTPGDGLNYLGLWNAATDSPTMPVADVDNAGHYFIVGTAGATLVDGVSDWQVGDWLVSNGDTWEKIDNSEALPPPNADTNLSALRGDGTGGGDWEVLHPIAEVAAWDGSSSIPGDGKYLIEVSGGHFVFEATADVASSGDWTDLIGNPFGDASGLSSGEFILTASGSGGAGSLTFTAFEDTNPGVPDFALAADEKKYLLHDSAGGAAWSEFAEINPGVPDFAAIGDFRYYAVADEGVTVWAPMHAIVNPIYWVSADMPSTGIYALNYGAELAWEPLTIPPAAPATDGDWFLRIGGGGTTQAWEQASFVMTNMPDPIDTEDDYVLHADGAGGWSWVAGGADSNPGVPDFTPAGDEKTYILHDQLGDPVWLEFVNRIPDPSDVADNRVLQGDGAGTWTWVTMTTPLEGPGAAGNHVIWHDGAGSYIWDPLHVPPSAPAAGQFYLDDNGAGSTSWVQLPFIPPDPSPAVGALILREFGGGYTWESALGNEASGGQIPVWDGAAFQGYDALTFDIPNLCVRVAGGLALWGGTSPASQPPYNPLTDSTTGVPSMTFELVEVTTDAHSNDNFATLKQAYDEIIAVLTAYNLTSI